MKNEAATRQTPPGAIFVNAIQIIGLIIFIIGGLAFLIASFRTSLLWGIGCLLIPPIAIVYLFQHWDVAKSPFIIQLIGVAILLGGTYAQSHV